MADDSGSARAIGQGLAGGAIASAMLETLMAKNVLTLDEARDVLQIAMRTIGPHMRTPEGFQASQVVGELLRGKFSARG
jgi:hypothetical protein